MGRKVGIWRRVKSDQMRGEGRCRSKGAEKAGTWGRWSQMRGGGRIKSFGEAEMGAGEGKQGKVGWEAVDSLWGVGEVCTGGVKNFSPFVSV